MDCGRHQVTCLCERVPGLPECTQASGPLIPASIHHPHQACPHPRHHRAWAMRSLCPHDTTQLSQITQNNLKQPHQAPDTASHPKWLPPPPASPGPQKLRANSLPSTEQPKIRKGESTTRTQRATGWLQARWWHRQEI